MVRRRRFTIRATRAGDQQMPLRDNDLVVVLFQPICFSANLRIASAGTSATEIVASIVTSKELGCSSVAANIRPEREVGPLSLTAT